MTNKEFFKEQILDIACDGKTIAVSEDTQMPCSCGEFICGKCRLYNPSKSCRQAFSEWCKAEHTEPEPCEFEKGEIVEVSDDNCDWRLKYFERKELGFYLCSGENGNVYAWKFCRKYGTLGNSMSKENSEDE